MKLLTNEIIQKMPKLYSTSHIKLSEKLAVAKFFTPDSNWSWYVVEGEQQPNGDWEFFGLVDGYEREWGYFTLSELQSIRGDFGLPVERDRHFDGTIPPERGW